MKLNMLAGLAAMALPAIAQAGGWGFSIGIGPRYCYAPGYCYGPRYYAPPPVTYYSPPAVVYAAPPPPVFYGPSVVIGPRIGFYHGGYWGAHYRGHAHYYHHRH